MLFKLYIDSSARKCLTEIQKKNKQEIAAAIYIPSSPQVNLVGMYLLNEMRNNQLMSLKYAYYLKKCSRNYNMVFAFAHCETCITIYTNCVRRFFNKAIQLCVFFVCLERRGAYQCRIGLRLIVYL